MQHIFHLVNDNDIKIFFHSLFLWIPDHEVSFVSKTIFKCKIC